jgi:hypothetical protein
MEDNNIRYLFCKLINKNLLKKKRIVYDNVKLCNALSTIGRRSGIISLYFCKICSIINLLLFSLVVRDLEFADVNIIPYKARILFGFNLIVLK